MKKELLNCLEEIGGCTNTFNLLLKGYNKRLWGKYDPSTKNIILYIHCDSFGGIRDKEDIIECLIHEYVHHEQWNNPLFIRKKGVMHNKDFWERYNTYINLAIKKKIIGETK